MRILNITNAIPYPLVSGAPIRSYNLIRRFAKDHDVYLAAFTEREDQSKEIAHLSEFCRRVITVERRSTSTLPLLKNLMNWPLKGGPAELRLSFSNKFAEAIHHLVHDVDFDVIQIEHGSMGLYLEAIPRAMRKKAIWVLHDIDFDKFEKISLIEKNVNRKIREWIHSKTMRQWQPHFAERFGLCVTMSEIDERLLVAANRRLKVEVSPNGVDTRQFQMMPEEEGENPAILFIGNMSYLPNIDAAVHFCNAALPLIRKKISNVEFWIVGINPGESVRSLAGDGVFVTGGVTDILPYYRRARVCVVPLRVGSGTRLKILEAMAMGRPVISTSIGAEGLDIVNGKHIAIADDSAAFAEKVIELLTNHTLRASFIKEARENVVANYDWDVIARRMLLVFETLGH